MTDQYKVYRDMPEKAKEEGIKLLQDLESKVRQEERSENFGYLWLELREGIALFDTVKSLARLYDWEEKHGSIEGPKIVLTHRRGTIIYCDPRMVPSEDSEDRKELNSLCSRWKILVFSKSDRDFMEDLLTGTVYEIKESFDGYHDELVSCVSFVELDSFRGVFAKFRHAKKNGEQFFSGYGERQNL